ncbi:MAG: hypothetical protein JSV65_09085 [Armatimonadota bacterium]|nr:MAG: hypothetical protein JSV65_09085 [Armatimonadota bacterium]
MAFATTTIGGIEVSRLTLGSNPFFGFSHKSPAQDTWLKRYFTDERIYEVLQVAAELGVNLFVSGTQQRFADLRRRLEDETGHHIYWACTPAGSDLKDLKADTDRTARLGAEICLPHTSWIEAHLHLGEREVAGLAEVLDYIRQAGMVPGVSTHRPEVLPIAVERGYDVETFILPFNVLGFLCPVEVEWQAHLINQCPKPLIIIKPLAAGRLTPAPGLTFVYDRVKPIDTVAIGVLSPEELREDAALAADLMAGRRADAPLAYTRSKEHLQK